MAVDPWLLGENLTALTISGLSRASNGALTIGATVNVVEEFLEVDPTLRMSNEDIRPTNQIQVNECITGEGTECRLVLLQRADAFNALFTLLAAGYRYFQLNWTQGAEPVQFRGLARSRNFGVKNRGANPDVFELGPINENNAPNLIRA